MNTLLSHAEANHAHLLPGGRSMPWAEVQEALEQATAARHRASNRVAEMWAAYKAAGHNPGWAKAQPGFRAAMDALTKAERTLNIVCRHAARYSAWTK